MRAFFKIQIFRINMRQGLFLIGFVAVFSLFSVLEVYAQTAPDKPDNFIADDVSSTKIVLQWDEPADDGGSAITGYKIDYLVDEDGGAYKPLVPDTGNVNTYSHTPVQTGKTYIYQIYSINAKGLSDKFATDIANPTDDSAPPEDIPPKPPRNLVATDISQTSILLSWDKPSTYNGPAVSGYKIERTSPIEFNAESLYL